MPDIPQITVDECYKHMKTGDLVMTTSEDHLIVPYNAVVGNIWSHVGVVYRHDDGVVYIWDIVTTKRHGRNTRLVPLTAFIARWHKLGSYVGYRRLNGPPTDRTHWQSIFRQLMKSLWNSEFAFEGGIVTWNRSLGHLFAVPISKYSRHRFYCSELAYEVYRRLGVVGYAARNEIIPLDFAEQTFNIELNPGYSFGPDTIVQGS